MWLTLMGGSSSKKERKPGSHSRLLYEFARPKQDAVSVVFSDMNCHQIGGGVSCLWMPRSIQNKARHDPCQFPIVRLVLQAPMLDEYGCICSAFDI